MLGVTWTSPRVELGGTGPARAQGCSPPVLLPSLAPESQGTGESRGTRITAGLVPTVYHRVPQP